jgi:limonene-1,2-epoxide hydrolase
VRADAPRHDAWWTWEENGVAEAGDPSVIEHNLAAARRVCEAWNVMDLDEFRELFDAQVDYRNIPLPGDRHVGPDAVHAVLSSFLAKWDASPRVDNIAAAGDIVLTERTECFVHRAGVKPGWELPVMGAFEFRDGKIVAWRDYWERTHMRLR